MQPRAGVVWHALPAAAAAASMAGGWSRPPRGRPITSSVNVGNGFSTPVTQVMRVDQPGFREWIRTSHGDRLRAGPAASPMCSRPHARPGKLSSPRLERPPACEGTKAQTSRWLPASMRPRGAGKNPPFGPYNPRQRRRRRCPWTMPGLRPLCPPSSTRIQRAGPEHGTARISGHRTSLENHGAVRAGPVVSRLQMRGHSRTLPCKHLERPDRRPSARTGCLSR